MVLDASINRLNAPFCERTVAAVLSVFRRQYLRYLLSDLVKYRCHMGLSFIEYSRKNLVITWLPNIFRQTFFSRARPMVMFDVPHHFLICQSMFSRYLSTDIRSARTPAAAAGKLTGIGRRFLRLECHETFVVWICFVILYGFSCNILK
jgi:hypothetical protein